MLPAMSYRDLSPADAHAEIDSDSELRVLDVRTEPEFGAYHIEGATLLPIQELQMRLDELDKDAKYVVYCEHGMRSAAACEFLAEQGFGDLRNVLGGMAAWVGAGLPYNQPK